MSTRSYFDTRTRRVPTRQAYARKGSDRAGAAIAQRRALRMAKRSVATKHYNPPTAYPMGELKGMDTLIAYSPVTANTSTNTQVTALNLIQTGTGSWNRIGRKTHLTSVRCLGYASAIMFRNTDGEFYGNSLRIILVWDKQPSGASEPAFDDIFKYTDQTGTEVSEWYSPPAYDTMDRFTVIKDWTVDALPGCSPAAGDAMRYNYKIECFVPLPNLESVYSGQSNPMTIADINTGALYLIARAEGDTAAQSLWDLNLICRLRYHD